MAVQMAAGEDERGRVGGVKLMRLHPNAGRPGICERIIEYICMAAARLIYRGMKVMARRMA